MSCRVGLIGCGNWGQLILRDLLELGCTVEVVDRSLGGGAPVRATGADRVVQTHDELGEVEAVLVITPDYTHAKLIGELLDRGVPIFAQKPLTMAPESADRLVEQGEDRIFSMHLWRYHQGIEAIADIARSGELGELQGVRSVRWGWGEVRPTSDSVYHLLPHDLSIGLEIIGSLPEARDASVGVIDGKPTDMVAMLGGGAGPWLAVDLSITRPDRVREVKAHFEGGVAILGGPYESEILLAGDPNQAEPIRRPIGEELPMKRELRAFVNYLVDDGPPPKTGAREAALIVRRLSELRVLAGLSPAHAED